MILISSLAQGIITSSMATRDTYSLAQRRESVWHKDTYKLFGTEDNTNDLETWDTYRLFGRGHIYRQFAQGTLIDSLGRQYLRTVCHRGYLPTVWHKRILQTVW
jgi:hypothetical protein